MTGRQTLPNARATETFRFEHEGVRYYCGVGRSADGSLAEMFLNAGKVGSAVGVISRDAAVVLSIALQHGVPLERIKEALSKLDDGQPAGPVGIALNMADAR